MHLGIGAYQVGYRPIFADSRLSAKKPAANSVIPAARETRIGQ